MTTLARRDDEELARGFTAWCAHQWPDAGYEIEGFDRPRAGWTNETLLVSLRRGGAPARPDPPRDTTGTRCARHTTHSTNPAA